MWSKSFRAIGRRIFTLNSAISSAHPFLSANSRELNEVRFDWEQSGVGIGTGLIVSVGVSIL